MARTRFFDGPLPRILAHRGLATAAPENSLAAFRPALAAGATHLETDARASADGVAVLIHDPRIGPEGPEVAGLPLAELRQRLPGLCTLAEALAALPGARFNIDVKDIRAAGPVAAAIDAAGAAERVLITSFRAARRLATTRALPATATSASSAEVALALTGVRLRLRPLTRLALARVDALQIPERFGRLDLTDPRLIAAVHAAGAEVHYWVVNDPERMRDLVRRGADGVVTDRPDLATAALR